MAKPAGWTKRTSSALGTAWRDLCSHSLLSWNDIVGQRGPLPDRIQFADPLVVEANPDKADALRAGRYVFAGDRLDLGIGGNPWAQTAPSVAWAEYLHSFAWLDHVSALDGEEAGICARAHVDGWMSASSRWDAVAWTPHVAARRMISWVVHARMILDGADLVWRSSLMRSLSRQAGHLANTAGWALDGDKRMTAAVGLTLSGLCLPHGEKRAERGLEFVAEEVERQILPDGGHISRNPESLLRIVTDLLNLKAACADQRVALPEPIQHGLDRAFPMIRFFRHGDGGFAHFNGTRELDPARIDAILALDETDGSPLHQANQSGYQRFTEGDTIIVMDTGIPADGIPGTDAHAGCLSFEMSVGGERLIVNCGATRDHRSGWRAALRSTAAHSTITIADTSSCSFLPRDPVSAFADGRVLAGPRDIVCERRDADGGTVVEASHDGYEKRFGLIHRRRLYLDAKGLDLRGEDMLVATTPSKVRGAGHVFAARFHLHPDVQADMAWDESHVTMTQADGRAWQFKVQGGLLSLEDSMYLDAAGAIRPAKQIVVSGTVGREPTVLTWSLDQVAEEDIPVDETIADQTTLDAMPPTETVLADPDASGEIAVETTISPELLETETPETPDIQTPLAEVSLPDAIPTETGPAVERPEPPKAEAKKNQIVKKAADNPMAKRDLDDWPPVRIEDIKVLEETD